MCEDQSTLYTVVPQRIISKKYRVKRTKQTVKRRKLREQSKEKRVKYKGTSSDAEGRDR